MPLSRSSTVRFDYAGFNQETIEDDIAGLHGEWSFELRGWVYLNDVLPQHFFRVWVCSRSSIARDIALTARERLQSNRPHFLDGVLVMNDETSVTSIERAVTDLVRECDAAAEGDWQQFYDLMLRFVDWDEDTFRWGYQASEPAMTTTMQLQIPRTSPHERVLRCTGSIEVEPGARNGFSVLACTNSWFANDGVPVGGDLSSTKLSGSEHVFPVGLMVVNEGSDWTEVLPALRQALGECESRAEGDRAHFRTLASRFIVWDGDPFAFPWSG